MIDKFSWQYDEFQQVGTDYGSKAEVDIYDSSHSDFRDLGAENIAILDALKIKRDHALIDFGAGTGTFVMMAAKRCHKVYAVDVSQAMIQRAKAKAFQGGVFDL